MPATSLVAVTLRRVLLVVFLFGDGQRPGQLMSSEAAHEKREPMINAKNSNT
jgi:hypothetical protein